MSIEAATGLLLLILGTASACGSFQRATTGITGGLTEKCARTGVVYVQSDSGIALLVDQAGKPVGCAP